MHDLHVFQILTPHVSRKDLDPGFEVLDNSSNERPDWYEYWPIRRFLLSQALDERAFYGFLSPRFKHKTNLSAAMVQDFVQSSPPATDVVLFSPSIQNTAYFLNVFEHGEEEHPGLARLAQRFFAAIGRPLDLEGFVSDSRNTVNSNYFVAKPKFWRAWFEITERLFAAAEAPDDALGAELRAPTSYRGRHDAPMKIFLIERIASWLLATDGSFAVRARDPFAARARHYKLPVAVACDALKIAYVTQGRPQYKEVFLLVRNLRKFLNMQIRLGSALGFVRVRASLDALKSHWRAASRDGEESK